MIGILRKYALRINRSQLLYVVWLFVCFNVYILLEIANVKQNDELYRMPTVKKIDRSLLRTHQTKKILLWNPWYGDFGFTFDDETAFSRIGCKVSNCVLSKDKQLVAPEKADAIVFLYTNLCELPKIHGRRDNQRFVLLTDDPPMCYPRNYFERRQLFGSFFNWTISYRDNADVTWKRGWISKLNEPKRKSSIARIRSHANRGKKKLVAWYVARCGSKSKREGYINELKEHIDIDIYGPCGNLNCPESDKPPSEALQPCLDMLADSYKFVLAFERFICDDFVTKRFFDLLSRDTVPIVFGGADYAKIAPPHSFIDALDYTPKQLAQHLLMLDKSERQYNKHFWWKNFYEVHSGYQEISTRPFCELCEKLNSDLPRKIYRDIDAWWFNSTKCSNPEDHGIVIKSKGKEDLHNIQIPWSLDD